MTKKTNILTTILASIAIVAALSGCSPTDMLDGLDDANETTETAPIIEDSPATITSADNDYYTVLGKAQQEYPDTNKGSIEYCEVDDLDRAVCAYGLLTSSQREAAQARGRQDINVDPAGWNSNKEIEILALDGVADSKTYHGWMFNRSHMVADSLGGDPIVENLVTGTRMQNVGSTQEGGQAYTEVIARNYLDTQDGDKCPLYYATTPQYTGDELLPRTTITDIKSCDGSIDERVEVTNTANGWTIDYADGSYAAAAK